MHESPREFCAIEWFACGERQLLSVLLEDQFANPRWSGGVCAPRPIVLLAQKLGLNSCWVALTFKKRLVRKMVAKGDKLAIVVALGHGATQGVPRKSKAADAVSFCSGAAPEWFARGVEFALLAPTAVNQQKFRFELIDGGAGAGKGAGASASAGKHRVKATTGLGSYADVDLGIAKLHFELGAGAETFEWSR